MEDESTKEKISLIVAKKLVGSERYSAGLKWKGREGKKASD